MTALLGAEYLAWCPVYGGDALEATLDKSPVSEPLLCLGEWLEGFCGVYFKSCWCC